MARLESIFISLAKTDTAKRRWRESNGPLGEAPYHFPSFQQDTAGYPEDVHPQVLRRPETNSSSLVCEKTILCCAMKAAFGKH